MSAVSTATTTTCSASPTSWRPWVAWQRFALQLIVLLIHALITEWPLQYMRQHAFIPFSDANMLYPWTWHTTWPAHGRQHTAFLAPDQNYTLAPFKHHLGIGFHRSRAVLFWSYDCLCSAWAGNPRRWRLSRTRCAGHAWVICAYNANVFHCSSAHMRVSSACADTWHAHKFVKCINTYSCPNIHMLNLVFVSYSSERTLAFASQTEGTITLAPWVMFHSLVLADQELDDSGEHEHFPGGTGAAAKRTPEKRAEKGKKKMTTLKICSSLLFHLRSKHQVI